MVDNIRKNVLDKLYKEMITGENSYYKEITSM